MLVDRFNRLCVQRFKTSVTEYNSYMYKCFGFGEPSVQKLCTVAINLDSVQKGCILITNAWKLMDGETRNIVQLSQIFGI